jgi:hypothetical protein
MIDFLACSKKIFDARFFDAVAQPPSTTINQRGPGRIQGL